MSEIEAGIQGPLGDDLFPALTKLGDFAKRHLKFLIPALTILTAQSTSISYWFPLQYSGLVIVLYAAYSEGQLALQDFKRYKFLIPGLIVLGIKSPAFSESISLPNITIILAIYAFYFRENPELQNVEASLLGGFQREVQREGTPFLVLLAVLVTQIELDSGNWTIVVVLFLLYMYQGRNNQNQNQGEQKLSLPLLIGAALAVPTLSLPKFGLAGEQAAETQRLVLFLAAYVAYYAHTEAAATAEAVAAFQTVSNRVGAHFKVGFVIGLACYMPIHHGLPLQFQIWAHFLFIVVIATIGYFSSPTKFCGPAKYGYIKYHTYFTQLLAALSDWWVYALFFVLVPIFLPLLGFGIMAITAGAWILVWTEYSQDLASITDELEVEISRVKLAEELGREYTSAADGYRKQILEAVATTRRDAFLAESARATDFFDCTATAWAALEGVIKPVDGMIEKAEETILAAQRAEDAQDQVRLGGDDEGEDEDGDDNEDDEEDDDEDFGGPGTELFKAATKAQKEARAVREKLTTAQEQIRASEAANKQHKQMRVQARRNAETAVSAAKLLEEKLKPSTKKFTMVGESAIMVKILAAKATVVASDGDMANARRLLELVKPAARDAERCKDELLAIVESVREVLLGYMGVA